MQILHSDSDIAEGVAVLTAIEPRFAAIVAVHGHPPLRRTGDGMESLLRIITDQLISLQAGEAIWRRLAAALTPLTPETVLQHSEEALMQLGLSRAKARCFRAVASAAQTGALDFAALQRLSDDDVLPRLTAIPGVGPWTAMIYLLSALGRADAWPVGDVALHVSAQHLMGLEVRPDKNSMMALAEPWRPWRAVAARLLWSHYRGLKGMDQKVT